MMEKVLTILFVLVLVLCGSQGGLSRNVNPNELKREILEQIISKDEIDVLIPPGNSTGGPMVVEVFINVLSIDSINEEKMEITYTLLLRQIWNDYRLRYDNKKLFDCITINRDLNMIWTPDMYLTGVKKSQDYDVPHPNVFARIYPNGTVISSKRIKVTRQCMMDLQRFPLDNQVCRLSFTLYGSTTSDIILKWRNDNAVQISRNLYLPLFTLEKVISSSNIGKAITGQYSVLDVDFLFAREFRYYLIHIYMPCGSLFFLALTSFWANKKLFALRLLICLACYITAFLMVHDVNSNLPKLSYNTSLDMFTGVTLSFIFSMVLIHMTQQFLEDCKSSQDNTCLLNGDLSPKENEQKGTLKLRLTKIIKQIGPFDMVGRYLYPLLYLLFCLIYGLKYKDSDDE